MPQVTLAVAPSVKWSVNFAKLGKFAMFLRSCKEFALEDSPSCTKMVFLNARELPL